jgi:TolB-like protein/predicted Ser/Thr protein kinase
MFETLGHYNILDRIGAGGMGEVYRARDTKLGRTVAIKVLAPAVANDPDRRDRFLREARATAALSHPNIAALYEIGEDQGQLFLVFEFVPGETLKNVIAGRPLNPRRAIDLAVQIADALAEAHAEGIVHRDIKPDNIIVTPKGNAKILDFGLATWTTGGADREHAATEMATGAGTTLGTVAYMSPEQTLGEQVDHRTDVFSLGIVLFEMMTGRLPFSGPTATALALKIVQAPAPAPTAVNSGLPRELDAIVAKALAKSLAQRYESAATMAAELRTVAAILDVRSGASEPASAPMMMPQPRRSYAGWILFLVVLAALGAAAWWQRAAVERLWRRTMGPAPAPVIAVIPLELSGSDPSQMFFADGLTEDLITRLGQTPGLKVIGRSATRNLRGRAPRDVARELGAAVVLTGSVRPSAEGVKVSLELIDPADGTAMWSGQYTRDVKNIFAVQAAIAADVAAALRVRLEPTASSARASARLVDRKAYELYLRGQDAMAHRRTTDAMQHFESAIAADEGLAEAFAGLAVAVHAGVAGQGDPDDSASSLRIKTAAERAYQLDPELAQANLSMGLATGSLSEALKYMRRSVELDASFAEAYHQIGDQIQDFAPEDAIAFYRRALELDSSLYVSRGDIATALMTQGRWDEAHREMANVPVNPDTVFWRSGMLQKIALAQHHFDTALAPMETKAFRATPMAWSTQVVALRMADRPVDALQEAELLASKVPSSCEGRALLAGLRLERGMGAAARQLANPIAQAAAGESAHPAALRCAALMAAALNDADQTAAILDRISGREAWLRYWAMNISGNMGSGMLAGRVYPWTNVADAPPFVAARLRMQEAYARERAVSRRVLAGVV